ncbi:hypothetical protein B0A48_05464 [Cryoendolithus antarcticus]|uniref:TOG domain-containing protein n=1 Tax=Cryoendolithus antarcticus TaxID=1507870 RepID=A0A1V8TIY8_9PEZI|nr:hypothetical protein B0A48_05464 [Cryoendolithus antarcticus]
MAEQEDFTLLPLPDQFAHKNWKARKLGYETAAKEFATAQPNAPIVRDFINDSALWKAAVGDSNVAAQGDALTAYNAFLDIAGTEGARKTRGSTITPIVEKGLTGRPAAKAAALEGILLLIELDKPDPVVEELLPLLSNKLPKIVVATLGALRDIYHAYGCKTVEPKPVLKLLPKMYGHADKNVRAEAQALTVELYRWLREAMKPLFWGELKPVQQTDLEKLFEPVKDEPAPKQERLLRSQQAAKEVAAAAGPEEGADEDVEAEEDAPIDLEPEFEAVDAFAKIPKDFEERLSSAKWKERKEALDDVFTAVNHPSIQEGQFDGVVRGCAKSMKDANIMVVTIAANCIEAMAKGLRKSFGRYRSTILASMLERFKEKKVNVTDAIGAACDAVFVATGLGDVEADILEALKNKNPQVKENTARFLIRCIKSTREVPSLEQAKELSETAKKLLVESAPGLRDAGAEILGVLWKIMTDRNMLNHLEGIDDIKKAKIKEFADTAEVKAKWKPKAAPPPKPAAAPAASGKRPAPGSKRPAPAKKVASRPQSPPLMADDPPLAPRPTSRPAAKPTAGLRPPGAGLKPPAGGLQRPSAGLKAPASSTASPRRQTPSLEPEPPATPSSRAPAARTTGLANRPLSKPSTAPPSPPQNPQASSLSAIERQELLDLRAELALSRQNASELRQDKVRLSAQITELQNQNAQLIEDHTRDVLSIKAKETQLVRARSDVEVAEDRGNDLSREVERLKREIARLGRGRGASESDGGGSDPSYARPGAVASSGRSYTSATGRSGDYTNGTPSHYPTASFSSSEGKENIPDLAAHSPSSSGHASGKPERNGDMRPPPPRVERDRYDSGGREAMQRSQSDGVESWKRAAEVTQNLKARIEMMKARQNIGRGQ